MDPETKALRLDLKPKYRLDHAQWLWFLSMVDQMDLLLVAQWLFHRRWYNNIIRWNDIVVNEI
jgi:hypothetical protein